MEFLLLTSRSCKYDLFTLCISDLIIIIICSAPSQQESTEFGIWPRPSSFFLAEADFKAEFKFAEKKTFFNFF